MTDPRPTMPPRDDITNAQAGYALLAAIMFVGITAVSVGLALVVASRSLDVDKATETSEEIQEISAAIYRYYEDTGSFPGLLSYLVTKPAGVANWFGPYVSARFKAHEAAGFDALTDAWGKPYYLETVGMSGIQVCSMGINGLKDGDDLKTHLEVNSLYWAHTRREIQVVETAIAAYNNHPMSPEYLPAQWESALLLLQANGFLPSGSTATARFLADAWGQVYVPKGAPIMFSVDTIGDPDSALN